MENLIKNSKLILMEAGVNEQLKQSTSVCLHKILVNAPLIYDEPGRSVLYNIYKGYMDIAVKAKMPFLSTTPTFRADKERVSAAAAPKSINRDAVHFLQEIRNSIQQDNQSDNIKIGGIIGPKNDCYKPLDGLSASESEQFHAWQINQLAEAGADFLMTATFPNVEEAKGAASAMSRTGIPYLISFVITRDGNVMDGTSLSDAITRIDAEARVLPLGYMVNCAYPTFLCADRQPAALFNRFIGYQANASSLDHCDLDGSDQLKTEAISDWGDEMILLNRSYGVKILGGCCGTGNAHLQYLVDNLGPIR